MSATKDCEIKKHSNKYANIDEVLNTILVGIRDNHTVAQVRANIIEHCKLIDIDDIYNEIIDISDFYSENIPVVYGDGTKKTEKYVPLYEVKYAAKCALYPDEE